VTHDVLLKAWDRALDGQAAEFAGAAGPQTAGPRERVGETLRVGPEERHRIDLTVNGERRQLWVAPNELLLNLLRERLEITGPKYGCGIGECGACTVLLDGSPALACLTLALSADGSNVLTVEGLQRPDGQLHPVQEAFIEHQGFQCGYCTPGMLMMSKTLLEQIPSATEDDVRSYLRGNRCRCTGYASIVRSVLSCVAPAGASGTSE
jgi:carbon-monoxide dehydrogenase small subunit